MDELDLTDSAHSFEATISTLPAAPRDRWLALAVIACSAAVFALLVPFAKTPLQPVSAFIPIYETAVIFIDLTTAVLLFGQFKLVRTHALFILGAGYLFTAITAMIHMLSFPGLFAQSGLLGAGPQTTAWLYMLWHGGFPVFVIAYAYATQRPSFLSGKGANYVFPICIATSLCLSVGGGTLTIVGQDMLPPIMAGNHYTSAMTYVITTVWLLSLLALAALCWWIRKPSVIDLWLRVVMFVWLFDIALSAMLNAGRFDVGFYAGRIYGLLAVSFVLLVLIKDNGNLHVRLASANEAIRRMAAADRQRLEEGLRRALEAAPNPMVMIDTNRRMTYTNRQTTLLFGFGANELLGQPIETLVSEWRLVARAGMLMSLAQSQSVPPVENSREIFARRKDGTAVPVEIGLNPIETPEGPRVLASIIDVSARRQKEHDMRAALVEKDLLLSEIHHRVKNNLQIVGSLLDLQMSGIDDPAVHAILADSQSRITSMALIHQALYQSQEFGSVDFSEFLTSLASSLAAAYGISSRNIELHIEVGCVHLPITVAVPCGLLINELITNAMKYAFPGDQSGIVEVRLTQQGSDVTLIVTDDGVGLPDEFDSEQSPTLGMTLVNVLTRQLSGRLSVSRRPTVFTLEFRAPLPGAGGHDIGITA